MEAINSAYAVSAPNEPATYRSERLYKDRRSEQRNPVVGPIAKGTDRQETIVFSGSSEKLPLYGATGKFSADDKSKGSNTPGEAKKAPDPQNDPRIQAVVARLKAIEEKVKAHEAAHKTVGGTLTGPISYTYTRGPDGKSYITGGEVPIKISTGKTPQETVAHMEQVIRAALAPADPSPQDRAVASQASSVQQQARMEMASDFTQNTAEKGAAPVGGNAVSAAPAYASPATDLASVFQKVDLVVPLFPSSEKTGAYPAGGSFRVGSASDHADRSIYRASRLAYTDPAVTGSKNEAIPLTHNSEENTTGIPQMKKTASLRRSASITGPTALPTAIYA
jgi:hypothetical protein